MTFAEELRNAVTHDPARPLPIPAEDAGEAAWDAYQRSRYPQPRVTAVRVLEVEEGLPELMNMALSKDLFNRSVWVRMGLQGAPEAQMREYLTWWVQDPTQAALWTQGTYFRVLVRLSQTTVFSLITVGQGTTRENRYELYRALWDVGVERFYGHMRKDHPHLQKVLADVPEIQQEPYRTEDSVTLIYPVDARGPRP